MALVLGASKLLAMAKDTNGLCFTIMGKMFFRLISFINDLPFLGDTQVVLGILSSYVACQPSYFTWKIPFFFPSYPF